MQRDAVHELDRGMTEYVETHAELPPHVSPLGAAVAVMSSLLERLTRGQAHELVAALPDTVQPLFAHCLEVREGEAGPQHIHAPELLDRVGEQLAIAPAAAELVTITVFRALQRVLPRDVVANVTHQLPGDLQELWRAPQPPSEPITTDVELRKEVLEHIERSGALPAHVPATAAFSAVMCLLGQRISGGEAHNLLLGLPKPLRPIVERCILHKESTILTFGADELEAGVADHLHTTLDDAARIVPAVFEAVRSVLPREEVEHVASQLPADLREVWTGRG
jgi:uncharacterized protein (DUF2267 family)